MAQLKDTIVSGSLRATDTIYTNILSAQAIFARSASNSTTLTMGTNGQILATSSTAIYWTSTVPHSSSASWATTAGNATDTTKVAKAGDQMSGTLSVVNGEPIVIVKSTSQEDRRLCYTINSENRGGLWDSGSNSASHWIVYSDSANNVYLNGHASCASYGAKANTSNYAVTAAWAIKAAADTAGNAIHSTYLKLSGGTMTGRLTTTKPINQIITGTGVAGKDNGSSDTSTRYQPAKWTFNTGHTAINGDTFIIKIPVAGHSYGVYLSIDNGTNYYPVVLNNTSRLTTQYPVNTYIQVVFESTGYATTIYPLGGGMSTGTQPAGGGVWRIINYYDSGNDYHQLRHENGHIEAGASGIQPYTLIALDSTNKFQMLVTSANPGTGTNHTINTSAKFKALPVILYYNAATATKANTITPFNTTIFSAKCDCETRRSHNYTTAFTAHKPLYIECTFDANGYWSPTTKCITQTFTSGNYYIYLGQAYATVYYVVLSTQHPIYYYDGTNLVDYTSQIMKQWGAASASYATAAGCWSTTRTFIIGNKSQYVNGSATATTWTVHDILYSTTALNGDTIWNSITYPGVYSVLQGTTSTFTSSDSFTSTSGEIAPYDYGQAVVIRANTAGISQFYISHQASSGQENGGIRYRSGWNNAGWKKWATILDSQNYKNFTVNKIGTGATGSWSITANTSNYSVTAKYSLTANTSNYSVTAKYALTANTSNYAVTAGRAITASYLATTAIFVATTGNYANGCIQFGYPQNTFSITSTATNLSNTYETWEHGLMFSQKNDEGSAIQLNGNYIVMWSPADSYTLRYFDEDSGKELWNINSSAVFSGKAMSAGYAATAGYATTSNYCIHAGTGGLNFVTSTNKSYLLGSTGTTSPVTTATMNTSVYMENAYLYASRVYNAVWNDYAEMREVASPWEYGQVVQENLNGIMTITQERLIPGAQIISDTFGTCMGRTDKAKTPIAVAGRVLAYPTQDIENYKAGAAVCSGPNGTVDIMTREEIKEYPDCIIGYVSEIPTYDLWQAGEERQEIIKVNGRIWIRIK